MIVPCEEGHKRMTEGNSVVLAAIRKSRYFWHFLFVFESCFLLKLTEITD